MRAPRKATSGSIAQQYVHSGSTLVNLVLGGGWARRRVANIVGDRSAGKTGMAVEACANFALLTDPLNIRYIEGEHAFDTAYGRRIGLPHGVEPVDTISTVEQMFADLHTFCRQRIDYPYPSLYVVDSLDALSDDAETKREMDKGSYHVEKAKKMSELFRRVIEPLDRADCTLIIISQLRDKIGVLFGERQTRSGGRALGFYASQEIWLSEIGKITHEVMGLKRATGVNVKIRNKKNKVGQPFRDAEFSLLFGYGIDDEISMVDWLIEAKASVDFNLKDIREQIADARQTQDREWLTAINDALQDAVTTHWNAVEDLIAPPMSKYAGA